MTLTTCRRGALALVLGVALVGCNKLLDKTTNTPSNKPVEKPYVETPDTELAKPSPGGAFSSGTCQAAADGSFDFRVLMRGGRRTGDSVGPYHFGEGGGCLNRPIRDAWGASMNQSLMVWEGKGNSGWAQLLPPPEGVTRFFDAHYEHEVENSNGWKVNWHMTWHHSVLEGTPTEPRRILINYRRYRGTKYIKYWEGSIILTRITDDVTAIWIRNQINATDTNETGARGGATDIIEKLRRGAPARDLLP